MLQVRTLIDRDQREEPKVEFKTTALLYNDRLDRERDAGRARSASSLPSQLTVNTWHDKVPEKMIVVGAGV